MGEAEIRDQRRQQMITVAKMYYRDKLPQDEIAKRLNMSRSNISRILSKSLEDGIVEISINDSVTKHPEIAGRLCQAYHLTDVVIASSHSDMERTTRNVGERLAAYLVSVLKNGMLVGVTSGRISYYAMRGIHNTRGLHVDCVQLMGGTSNHFTVEDSQSIAVSFSNRFNGNAYILPAPLMVKTKQLKQLFLQEPLCMEVFQKYSDLSIALLEISPLRARLSSELREPWLSYADSLQLGDLAAVSSVCGRYFDLQGMPCNAGINDRVIAMDLDLLENVPITVGTAAGLDMLEPTLSILRSGLINVLVVDEVLACGLEETSKNERS